MSYTFPKILAPLREYLRGQGADVKSFVSARQAAFMAQQLIGSRVKFPPHGEDMTPTLLRIQEEVPADAKPLMKPTKKKATKPARIEKHRAEFAAKIFATGIHIFCDGACEPNPGSGGWGVAVYRDGREIAALSGGLGETTNNVMELTGMLEAIQWLIDHFMKDQPATIWCDSQYVVKGCNEWRHNWKRNGWSKRKPNSPKHAEGEIKNLDLWKAIDEALNKCSALTVAWVKGHVGIEGNERADELSLIGRRDAMEAAGLADPVVDHLDTEYRAIMAG